MAVAGLREVLKMPAELSGWTGCGESNGGWASKWLWVSRLGNWVDVTSNRGWNELIRM